MVALCLSTKPIIHIMVYVCKRHDNPMDIVNMWLYIWSVGVCRH